MATLNDFPKIAKSLKTSNKNQIQLLHRLIIGEEGDRLNRSRLRKFSGFPSDFQFEETKQKVVAEFSLKDLIAKCNLLHLEFYTDLDKCDTILTHLSDHSLLTTEASDFSETEDLDESEPKLTDSLQSEKLKIYEKLFNTSRTFRPNNDKKFDDPTHAAKFDRKRTRNPQAVCYSCGLTGHKSTQCTNKPHGKQCYGCKNFGHIHTNCPQNSRNSASKSDSKLATPARTVNQISAQNFPQNLMHVDITLSGIQLTALSDTGSQAAIINEKTYLRIGSKPLYPSQITFSGIGRNTVQSIGFFQDSITVQNLTLPAKIHVLSDDTLPLDVLIGIDFLQQTQFTFDKDGIRFCSNNDEYFLLHVANVIDDCPFDLSHVSVIQILEMNCHH
ncbi:hypothetical protein AVEN_138512-1 [Araneus ventricosus]|uniref:CCHC-type domain-containing protein n=1 Tax=Araneus ventricosus TaxID=182803 RepID=A0A4Y2TYV6_ARAVE|nr:hypothetical protein AVEN_138512-1 [Araneus ventricosus]